MIIRKDPIIIRFLNKQIELPRNIGEKSFKESLKEAVFQSLFIICLLLLGDLIQSSAGEGRRINIIIIILISPF